VARSLELPLPKRFGQARDTNYVRWMRRAARAIITPTAPNTLTTHPIPTTRRSAWSPVSIITLAKMVDFENPDWSPKTLWTDDEARSGVPVCPQFVGGLIASYHAGPRPADHPDQGHRLGCGAERIAVTWLDYFGLGMSCSQVRTS
jgi:hypothetical protein